MFTVVSSQDIAGLFSQATSIAMRFSILPRNAVCLCICICTVYVFASPIPLTNQGENRLYLRRSPHEAKVAPLEEFSPRGFVQNILKKVGTCCGRQSVASRPNQPESSSHEGSMNHGSPPQTHQNTVSASSHNTSFSSAKTSPTATLPQKASSSARKGSPARYDSVEKYERPDAKAKLRNLNLGVNTPWYHPARELPGSIREMKKMHYQPASKPFEFFSGSSSGTSSPHSRYASPPNSPPHGQGKGKEAMVTSSGRKSNSSNHSDAAGPSGLAKTSSSGSSNSQSSSHSPVAGHSSERVIHRFL
ncbi:unnamed protein product [Sympodiomycopsis kandeliae]